MAKDKSEALQGLAKSLEDLSGIGELAEEIKDLKDVIVDSNEELIATFVEGTKRIIKKEDKDVSPQLRNLSESITGGLEAVKKGVAEVERGVKSIKLPSGTDFRATGAMLKLPIKELTRVVESLDLNISTDAKKPIAVRLSDGENFYKALDQVIQTISGGGSTSYAFETSSKSPGKGLIDTDGHVQVDVLTMPGVTIDTTGLATEAKQNTIITHIDGVEGLLTTIDADTGNIATSVASIDTKTPALGQALAAASVPVVLTAAQLTTLTPLSTVAVTNAGLTALNGAISGTEVQVDVLTMPTVTVTATNLDVQSGGADLATTTQAGAIQTAVELIDDTVFVDDTATHTPASTKLLGIGGVATPTDTSVNANDIGMFAMSVDRRLYSDANIQQGDADVSSTNELYVRGSGTAGTADAAVLSIQGIASMTPVQIGDNSSSITVDNGGTFATQVDGAALTALQLIDNTVYVDDADWTADTSSHNLVGSVTQVAPTANTDGDTTPLISDGLRQLRVAALESDLATAGTAHVKKYYTNAGAVTDGIIWSPAAGKRWFLTHLSINVSAAATVTIEDDLGGGDSAVYKAEFAANSGVVLTFPEVPMFSGEDAADLLVTTSAGNVYITAVGYEI